MTDEALIILLAINLGLCLIVGMAASHRGQSGVGYFLLSLFISPILAGFILLLFAAGRPTTNRSIPDGYSGTGPQLGHPDPSVVMAWKHQQQRRAIELPQPLDQTWEIARGDHQLGPHTITQIDTALRDGTLTRADYYFDPQAGQWLELTAHPRL